MSICYVHTIRIINSHVFVCKCGHIWEFTHLRNPTSFPDKLRLCTCGEQYSGKDFSEALSRAGKENYVDPPEYND